MTLAGGVPAAAGASPFGRPGLAYGERTLAQWQSRTNLPIRPAGQRRACLGPDGKSFDNILHLAYNIWRAAGVRCAYALSHGGVVQVQDKATLLLVFVALLAALVLDLVATPGSHLPLLFGIPVLLAAHRWPPRPVAVTAVVSLAFDLVAVAAHSFPLETSVLGFIALPFIGYLAVLFSARRQEAERERSHAQELAELAGREAARLEATIRSVADGLVIYDASGDIQVMNPAAEAIFGFSEAERRLPIDERLRLVTIETPEGHPLALGEVPAVRALRGETVRNAVLVLRTRGREVWVSVSAAPVRGAMGELAGAVATFADVTALHQLQEERETIARTISHDLRNPLTVILGTAEMLQRGLALRGLEREASGAARIARSAQGMNAMIQDLVETARLESGRFAVRQKPVDLTDLVREISERVGTAEDQARLRLEVVGEIQPVLADPERLERAVVNLLTNALKYSPPESPVTIRLEQRGAKAVVSVIDRGVGIPEDDIPRVFERFYRASTAGKADGLGLGLYIARLILEAHGERLWVDSRVGEGSAFRFTLPIAA